MACARIFLAFVLLGTISGVVVAQRAVLFTDGRSMTVEDVERDGGHAVLYLSGGGAIAVPAERIANWEELSRPPAVLPQASAGPAAPQPGGEQAPWRFAAGEFADLIGSMADRHHLDPALLTAMAEVESAFDPQAVSPQGASGLLQLMPDTADRFGVGDVFDVGQNVEGGARYMSWLLERYDGRTELALAGYNAGEGAVDRHRGVPPFRETQRYVKLVMAGRDRLTDPAR